MRRGHFQVYQKLNRRCVCFLCAAMLAALFGVALTLATQERVILPYADVQLAAAQRMEKAEALLHDYVVEHGIAIEKDDLNATGLIGPEWTELTTSLGMLEAKRTALQPDFAALMVKYYQEAGLEPGDTVCCGTSGSFPALCIAAIAAANEMDLHVKVIASYGSSMYGATRTELSIVRIIELVRQAGLIDYELLAVSPGGDFDQGNNLLFADSRQVIFAMAQEDQAMMIDEATIPATIQRRLELYGENVDCFVNVGGASANMGTSPYTLTFPNGLVLDPPTIPTDEDRGLTFEYAARHIPVIHLLNVRGLAEENGIPFDPVPLTKAGATDVYYTTSYHAACAIVALMVVFVCLFLGSKAAMQKGATA